MKKIIISLFVISVLIVGNSFAAEVRSSVQKARKAKARCEAITDTVKKEACLKELEEKSSKNNKDINIKK